MSILKKLPGPLLVFLGAVCLSFGGLIVKSFEGIKLINLTHQGKTIAQNSGVKEATGNIVVFSDANNLYQLDAIKKLVAPFADDRIGVVCGPVSYTHLTLPTIYSV